MTSPSDASGTSEDTATARPKRGKWHRPIGGDFMRRWACSGLLVRPGDEHRPVTTTAPEDRCRVCWRTPASSDVPTTEAGR